jgi:hypothetical protein
MAWSNLGDVPFFRFSVAAILDFKKYLEIQEELVGAAYGRLRRYYLG